MRILLQSKNRELIVALGHLFTEKKISYLLEEQVNVDWSQESYGEQLFTLWIESEDDYSIAKKELTKLMNNSQTLQLTFEEARIASQRKQLDQNVSEDFQKRLFPRFSSHPTTLFFLILLSFFFIFPLFFPKKRVSIPSSTTQQYFEQLFSPVEALLLFDYPKAIERYDRAIATAKKEGMNSQEKVSSFIELNQAAAQLQEKKEGNQLYYSSFEQIRKGQIWRVCTPSLLHGSSFHFFCTFLWTALLLTAVESFLQNRKILCIYLFWIAALSNTAQYIVSGPLFFGFSGVLCGLAGYLSTIDEKIGMLRIPLSFRVEKELIRFVQFFIFSSALYTLFAIEIESLFHLNIDFSIANTAHITGWIVGVLLGKRDSIKRKDIANK